MISAAVCRRLTFFGRLTAVVHRVAKQVGKRGFPAVREYRVHLGILADDFKPDLFAQRARQIAHHAGKAMRGVTERTHPGAEDFEVKPVEVGRTAVKGIEFLQAVGQTLAAFGHPLRERAQLPRRRVRKGSPRPAFGAKPSTARSKSDCNRLSRCMESEKGAAAGLTSARQPG